MQEKMLMDTRVRKKIFLSYNHHSQHVVDALSPDLKRFATIFAMDESIDVGDDWPSKVSEGLQGCDLLLLLVTEESCRSLWVQFEVILAKTKFSIPIIPVLIGLNKITGGMALLVKSTKYYLISEDVLNGSPFDASKLIEAIHNQLSCASRRSMGASNPQNTAAATLPPIVPELEEQSCVVIAACGAERQAEEVSHEMGTVGIRVHLIKSISAANATTSFFNQLYDLLNYARLWVVIGDPTAPDFLFENLGVLAEGKDLKPKELIVIPISLSKPARHYATAHAAIGMEPFRDWQGVSNNHELIKEDFRGTEAYLPHNGLVFGNDQVEVAEAIVTAIIESHSKRNRVFLLHGSRGLGKSTIARKVAHRLDCTPDITPHRSWYIDVQSYKKPTKNTILDAVFTRPKALINDLARGAFIVLDGCDVVNDKDLRGAIQTLMDLGANVLVTLRKRLEPFESFSSSTQNWRNIELGAFSPQQAKTFYEREWNKPGIPETTIAVACEVLHCHAMAIRLFARNSGSDRIDRDIEIIRQRVGTSESGSLTRVLRVTFEMAWAGLSQQQQEHAARLFVFDGDFDAAAMRAVCAAPDTDSLIQELVERGLLTSDNTRYWLHGYIREQLTERVSSENEREATRTRFCRHYIETFVEELSRLAKHRGTHIDEEGALLRDQAEILNALTSVGSDDLKRVIAALEKALPESSLQETENRIGRRTVKLTIDHESVRRRSVLLPFAWEMHGKTSRSKIVNCIQVRRSLEQFTEDRDWAALYDVPANGPNAPYPLYRASYDIENKQTQNLVIDLLRYVDYSEWTENKLKMVVSAVVLFLHFWWEQYIKSGFGCEALLTELTLPTYGESDAGQLGAPGRLVPARSYSRLASHFVELFAKLPADIEMSCHLEKRDDWEACIKSIELICKELDIQLDESANDAQTPLEHFVRGLLMWYMANCRSFFSGQTDKKLFDLAFGHLYMNGDLYHGKWCRWAYAQAALSCNEDATAIEKAQQALDLDSARIVGISKRVRPGRNRHKTIGGEVDPDILWGCYAIQAEAKSRLNSDDPDVPVLLCAASLFAYLMVLEDQDEYGLGAYTDAINTIFSVLTQTNWTEDVFRSHCLMIRDFWRPFFSRARSKAIQEEHDREFDQYLISLGKLPPYKTPCNLQELKDAKGVKDLWSWLFPPFPDAWDDKEFQEKLLASIAADTKKMPAHIKKWRKSHNVRTLPFTFEENLDRIINYVDEYV